MTKVPELKPFQPTKPQSTLIVCSRGKLTSEDKKQLELYMQYRRKRAEKKSKNL